MGEIVIAKIYVNGVTAVASMLKKIPKGLIGATIQLTFGDDWSGMTKTAVFKGAVTKDVLIEDDTVTIPAECVAQSGHRLKVGFYGVADGTLAIPTIWADMGQIRDAADPSGDTSTDPSLPVWAQLQDQLAGITGGETATGVQINLNAHTNNKANPHGVTAEQVGARPDTWLPSLEEINAAPGNFGLGSAQYFTADQLDSLTKPGFFYTNNEMTIAGFTSSRWWIEVSAYGEGVSFATQQMHTFYDGKGYTVERHKVNETWGEWGWFNPPMLIGTEYRTTERWAAKVVYTKLVHLGTTTAQFRAEPAFDSITNLVRCVPNLGGTICNDWDSYTYNTSGGSTPDSNAFYFLATRAGTTKVTVLATCGTDRRGLGLYAQFWYTKD